MYDQLDQVPDAMEIEDRPGQRPRVGLSDAVFYAGCFALALLPATLAGVLLHDFIGEPILFLAARIAQAPAPADDGRVERAGVFPLLS